MNKEDLKVGMVIRNINEKNMWRVSAIGTDSFLAVHNESVSKYCETQIDIKHLKNWEPFKPKNMVKKEVRRWINIYKGSREIFDSLT